MSDVNCYNSPEKDNSHSQKGYEELASVSHSNTKEVKKTKGRFIFFAPTIANVGGGQLYIAAKSQWLEEEGWEVRVIYLAQGEVVLPGLKKYSEGWSEYLQFRFISYTSQERKEAAEWMLGSLPLPERVIIESYSYETALWGEYMASLCHGKHICYLLGEVLRQPSSSMREFLYFKLAQQQLFGITSTNIPSILPECEGVDTYLKAEGCSQFNAPDIEDPRISDVPEDGFTILNISRLEKPYMEDMVKCISEFSQQCVEPINFILIGDTPNAEVRNKLLDTIKANKNIRLFFWGYTFPVPRGVYEKADVFIGCAGSANTAYKERVPVITIDANDHMGIGLLGETTFNRVYRASNEPPLNVVDLLKKVYIEKSQRRMTRQHLSPIKETLDFSRHKEIMDSPMPKTYYPVEKVRNGFLFDTTYNLLKLFGGRTTLYRVKNFKHKIFS